MTASSSKPRGFLTLTLHAHLPYVVNHGSWPHGIEWLHEAAAETYLPLLRMLGWLERDGIALCCNLNLSPILLEQLAHPVFQTEFPKYLERKIAAAREDEAFFVSTNEHVYAESARFWQGFFSEALSQFEYLKRDLISGFRYFADKGLLEIITCAATHGYMPLLGTDESLRAQVRLALVTHEHHLGSRPRGIWAPECGYRPSGVWSYPVTPAGDETPPAPFERIGVEQALSESGLEFFFVDTHLVQESAQVSSPYDFMLRSAPAPSTSSQPAADRRLYHPFYVDGPYAQQFAVTIFPRDPRTGLQVWSGESGYPGDENYLDFHKKRWPGGHRYWRVTGPRVDIGDKQPYIPAAAAERVREHAAHFVSLVLNALAPSLDDGIPPILCSPFDAELFGHWWFEGIQWLEAVARQLQQHPQGLSLTNCSAYLDQYPRAGSLALHEGSWGAEGTNKVWMNPDTAWTYTYLYAAEIACREVCTAGTWRGNSLAERVVKQLCRELLLLESSDWQFLITTGAARDYAEMRFNTHRDQFDELLAMVRDLEQGRELTPEQNETLADIEERDSIFAWIDPGFWASGAHAERDGVNPAAAANGREAAGPQPHPCVADGSVSEIPKYLPASRRNPGDTDEPA